MYYASTTGLVGEMAFCTIAKPHGRSVLRNELTRRFKVEAKMPRPKVLPPPRTEW